MASEDEGALNEEDSGNETPSRGVIISEGSEFTIHDLAVSLVDEKISVSHSGVSLRLDLCRHWLKIAIEHVDEAALPHQELGDTGASLEGSELSDLLESEFRSSMQAIISAAIALDAFYSSIKERVDISPEQLSAWRRNRTARWKQMAEVFHLTFNTNNRETRMARGYLREIFRYRDWTAHPPAGQQAPVYRQDLNCAVEWRFAAFRFHNAASIVQMSLLLVANLTERNARGPDSLKSYCNNLRTAITPFIDSWGQHYESYPIGPFDMIGE